MPDSIFLDSNVCLYILDKHSNKFEIAKELLERSPKISTQVMSENINVCVKKFNQSKSFALQHAQSLQLACDVVPVTKQTMTKACSIFERHNYSIFDCLILAAALEARCKVLYSEDMHHGHVLENQLRIVNPFAVLLK